jgi:hypothetical protein
MVEEREKNYEEQHFCNVNEDGICGMHKVEVERRNTDRNRLEDTRKDFKDFKRLVLGHISDLCTFKNRMLGLGILGTLVVLGNYGWTTMIRTELHAEIEKASARIEDHKASTEVKFAAVLLQVSNNRTDMAVIASQLTTTNERLREVILLIEKDRREAQQDRADRNSNK